MLYNGLLFPGGEGDKDQIYLDRGVACHPGRDGGQCSIDQIDDIKEIDITCALIYNCAQYIIKKYCLVTDMRN